MIKRNQKPLHTETLKFLLPEIDTFKLSNGFEVFFVQKKTLPFLYMNLVSDAGSKNDPNGKKGLANLFALMADEGAAEYDSLQLSDEFDVIGAHFSISCIQDSIHFSLQVLKEEFERGLDLFTKIIFDPHLDQFDFAREKRKVNTRILQIQDDADEIANQVFEYKLFGDSNPYAFPTIGYEKDVDTISISDIREFYRNNLRSIDSFLIVVGDYSAAKLKQVLDAGFGKWNSSSKSDETLLFKSSSAPGLYVVNKKDSVQSELRTGLLSFKRNDYDYFARSILNTIFGGQFSSRINLNLRENKGFTYGAFSRFIYFKSAAYFYISTSVGIENTKVSINEIKNEIEKIRSGITDEELEFAKSSLIRKFPANFESHRQIAANIVGQIIHSLPEDYFETYIDKIKEVTMGRVIKAAEDNLNPDNFITIVVGDTSKLADQLKKVHAGGLYELDIHGNLIGEL